MNEADGPGAAGRAFSKVEGLALALSYMKDPAAVRCPRCGPGTMEVLAYLDLQRGDGGVVRRSAPEGEYSAVLFCHECRRVGSLDLRPYHPRDVGSHGDSGRETDSGEDGGRRAA